MSNSEAQYAGPELVVTMAAVDRLQAVLEDARGQSCMLRITAEGPEDDPAFIFSIEQETGSDDVVLDYARITVLLDPESHRRLRGHELDYRHDENGEHFLIRRTA